MSLARIGALAGAALVAAAACVNRPASLPAPMPAPGSQGPDASVRPAPAASAAPAAPGAGDAAVELWVAATTDVHGRLRGWDYYAGRADSANSLAAAATIVDSVRRAHPGRVVLLDAGDLLQGNPLAYVASRAGTDAPSPIVAAMNAMRYDGAAIGNHEYNYGVPLLERAVREASFPFLSANTYRPGTRERVWKGWTVVERGGVKVGIVGATTPGVMVWDRDHVRGRLEVGDIVPAVREAVGEARAAGAEVVLVTVHSGLDGPASYDTAATGLASENVTARVAREVAGIDAIVLGHSHREVADTTINGVLLVQPKNWAASVAVMHLAGTRGADGRVRLASKRGQVVRVRGHADHPDVLAATDAAHRATIAYVTSTAGSTPVAWRADSARVVDSPITDFVLEVMRRASGAQLAATAAFSTDAGLDAGPVTVAELARLYPYDNTLRAVRVSGAQLRAFIEHSARFYRQFPQPAGQPLADPSVPGYNFDIVAGADYVLDLGRPVGQRVTSLTVGGRAVAERDSFTMAVNNYRQAGGGGFSMLQGAPVVHDEGLEIRQLLIDEVRRRGTIRPGDFHRRNWRIAPAAAAAAAYGMPRPRAAAAPAAGGRRLRIVGTNDFHGALEARPDARGVRRGGAAALAGTIARAKQECGAGCQSLLLDGGDMFQGTPASNLSFGRPVVELYRRLGYAAAALGNHEFDWGQDTLRARMRQAPYAILGANVRDAAGRDVRWIRDDTIVRRGAFRVGIIGIASPSTPRTTRASNVADLRFLDPAPVIDAAARRLRARGANAVVVVAHEGGFCEGRPACEGDIIEVARRVTEKVDAIVSGHTHSMVNAVVNGIPIVQARSSGRSIATVDLVMDAAGRVAAEGQGRVIDVLTDSVQADSAIDALVRRETSRVAALVNRPVADIAEAMPRQGEQYALGNLIADAQRVVGRGDVSVMNNGGIRSDLRAGPATYGTLFEVQPFANALVRLTVSGAALRQYLERLVGGRGEPRVHVSGVTVRYDPAAPAGSRVRDARMADGSAIDDAREYRLVLSDFLATGGDGLGLSGAAVRTEALGLVDLDAMITYLRQLPQPVRAPGERRLVPEPRP